MLRFEAEEPFILSDSKQSILKIRSSSPTINQSMPICD